MRNLGNIQVNEDLITRKWVEDNVLTDLSAIKELVEGMFELDDESIPGKTLIRAKKDGFYTLGSLSAGGVSSTEGTIDITKEAIESVLTGNIQSHTHDQYLTQHQSLKTINGESIAGTGNIVIQGGSSTSMYYINLPGRNEEGAPEQESFTSIQALLTYLGLTTQQWNSILSGEAKVWTVAADYTGTSCRVYPIVSVAVDTTNSENFDVSLTFMGSNFYFDWVIYNSNSPEGFIVESR